MVKCTWWEYAGRYSEVRDGIRSPIMRNMATGEECSGRDLPVGALWVATGFPDVPDDLYPTGSDGLAICCRLPGHHTWFIDGSATNCTMPDDEAHRCWVRHGTVGEDLHVDKNGLTCSAGAGSIAVPGYHGFLHHGELTDA